MQSIMALCRRSTRADQLKLLRPHLAAQLFVGQLPYGAADISFVLADLADQAGC
jgi:hypothetical protein